MRRLPWTVAGLAMLLAALLLPAAQPPSRRTEAQAKAAQKEIDERLDRTRRQVQKDAADQERLNKLLRAAERDVSRANGDLSALRSQRAQRAAARAQLAEERARRQAEREATEGDLASQLRAAYFMGRSEPLKLLLNQRNPAEFGRNLTYYGYLGRLRATQIDLIKTNIAKIDELTGQIDEEDANLAELMLQQKQRLNEHETAVKKRAQVLSTLKEEARDHEAELRRLQAERRQVEQLLEKLRRESAAVPYDPDSPFGQRRNKLSWPVAGRIVANFGASVNGLSSLGIDIDADAGATVRAIHDGVVVHADWIPGRGNLIILNHGDGYWSVYAHNDNLFKAVNDKVAAGEKIATVGNTGGRRRAGLYFELRHATSSKSDYKAIDPRPWFRSAAPPSD